MSARLAPHGVSSARNVARRLVLFAWVSIGAAVATIALKASAYRMTGSVGLLSDAVESLINLVAAILALAMIMIAAKPPDEDHAFGYSKAEYFASGFEGAMILIAAVLIAVEAFPRLWLPQPLQQLGIGLSVSALASAINLMVGQLLIRAGRRHNSIALEADGHHLMTDVWTSVGIIVGLLTVMATDLLWLDALIALLVAANILLTGFRLLRRSALGLLDRALPGAQRARIDEVLASFEPQGIRFHAVRTRQAAGRSFVSMHVLVPGAWTVQRGHDLLERIEADIRSVLPGAVVFTHLEPIEDPVSMLDQGLTRNDA